MSWFRDPDITTVGMTSSPLPCLNPVNPVIVPVVPGLTRLLKDTQAMSS